MKKEKAASKTEVKKDVKPVETSHFKNGHKWLAWIMGLTTVWTLVLFVSNLCGDDNIPQSLGYLNVWYVVNMGLFTILGAVATFSILKKSPAQIFWSGSLMFVILLQSISLVILYFYRQDSAAINGLAMFVWSACWYGYMLTAHAVEADLPARHRHHPSFGHIVLGVLTLSTVCYGLMTVIKLLW